MQVYNSRNSPSRSTPTHTKTSQIYANLNSDNIQQGQRGAEKKQENLCHSLPISLCEALCEICLLQVEPLGTTDFLPCCRGDLRTAKKIQVFQQRQMTQRLQKIWCSICTFRVSAETPAVFCQNQSAEKTLRQQQVQVYHSSGQLQLIRQLHPSHHASEFEQLPTGTNARCKEQENLQPFLSKRHNVKFAVFKFGQLAPCSFCLAAAGI